MDIHAALASIGPAMEVGKKVMAALSEAGKTDLRLQVGQLANSLVDAKLALADAKEALDAKDREIKRLKDSFQRREEAISSNGYKYKKGIDGKPKGDPYCPRCDEVDGRLICLHLIPKSTGRPLGCPQCKSEYLDAYPHEHEAPS